MRITAEKRQAIAASIVAGLSDVDVARTHGVTIVTAAHVRRAIARAIPPEVAQLPAAEIELYQLVAEMVAKLGGG